MNFEPGELKTQEGRRRLASLAENHLQASYSDKGSLPQRWKDLRSMVAGESGAAGSSPSGEAPNKVIQFPLLGIHVNRVASAAVTALTAADPWVSALFKDPIKGRGLAQGMQVIMESSGWDRVMIRLLHDLALFRRSICRTNITPTGIKHEPIALENFIASPNYAENLMSLACHGHKFTLPQWQIKERQQQGIYFEDHTDLAPDNEPETRRNEMLQGSSQQILASTVDDNWLPIGLAHLIMSVNVGGEMVRLRVLVVTNGNHILRIEKYPYQHSEYWTMGSPLDATFWPDSSPAAALQLVQDSYTTLLNTGVEGSEMAAFPMIFANIGTEKKRIQAGQIHSTVDPSSVQVTSIPFRADTIMPILDKLESTTEAVMGSAPAGLAQEYKSGTTAAEVLATVEGQRQRDQSFLTMAAHGIEDQYAGLHELCQKHAPLIAKVYGRRLDDSFFEALDIEPDWHAAGRNAGQAAAVQVALLERLMEMSLIPGSRLKRAEIERQIVQASGLRFGLDELLMNDDEAAEAAAAQMGPAQGGAAPGMGEVPSGMPPF